IRESLPFPLLQLYRCTLHSAPGFTLSGTANNNRTSQTRSTCRGTEPCLFCSLGHKIYTLVRLPRSRHVADPQDGVVFKCNSGLYRRVSALFHPGRVLRMARNLGSLL